MQAVNRELTYLHGGSHEITLTCPFKSCRTVPLRKDKKELCDFIFFIALLKVNIN